MDRALNVLALLLVLLAGAVISLVLSTPLAAIAIWRYSKTRRHLHVGALLTGLLNGLGQGLLLGGGGFALGAGIGDENAGSAALFLGGLGLIIAGGAAFVLSYLLVFVGSKLVGRRPQPLASADR